MLKEGDEAPDIELPDQDGNLVRLSDFKGQKVLVYFYPRDNTPGCTTEAVNFRDHVQEYADKGVKIIGISADSVNSHKKFQERYGLNFTLLSDKDKKAARSFGALTGPLVRRRTWIIDEDWKIEKVYEKVSPSKHHGELCEFFGM